MSMMKKVAYGALLGALVTATAFAAPPTEGIYVKRAADGTLQARATVVDISHYGAPHIVLEGLTPDNQDLEKVVTVYSWKTDNAGAGERGLRFTKEDAELMQYVGSPFTPKRFSTATGQEQVTFFVPSATELRVTDSSELLNGSYTLVEKETGYYPLANYYDLWVSRPGADQKSELLMEQWGGVMLCKQGQVYDVLHTDKQYAEISRPVWEDFQGSAETDTNVLYLHRYMAANAPALLEGETQIRMTDFYSGEGAEARTTTVLCVQKTINDKDVRVAKADVMDNGEIIFKRYAGQGAIKGEQVRMRAEPSTKARIVSEQDTGFPLDIQGFVAEQGGDAANYNWAMVKAPGGQYGYVFGNFVSGVEKP